MGFLRQPPLEGLTRSARTDSPRQVGRNNFRRHVAAAAAAFRGGKGRRLQELRVRVFVLVIRSRTPQNPLLMLNTLSSVSVRESRIQYLCDPQWFRDTASRGPTTIVAPESQFRTCPTDHGSRTPQNPLLMLNTLSSVSVRKSRIQYLCDPQWFRDTASRGPTTIVAPESQFRTCPTVMVRASSNIAP
ncbi:hypothetical protein F511_23105 [Dorcoceras hygrometricum]|uniref:Uncharacterized protein n=1 Tax=Dorcoceras hygrometricum TaxID=472368 RepID=A0A2Z7A5S4_9LAMI|nr:hypothetical protein F511_23105 [Dorcoceras hygrometricum]